MKRGPKPRQVTQDLLEKIEHHAARGLSQKQICDALGFSETWWHAKKAEYSELGESYKKGSASELADVTNALYENAMNGNPVSQIFFLKNRDPNRWNDVKSINHLQLNVSKMPCHLFDNINETIGFTPPSLEPSGSRLHLAQTNWETQTVR